MEFATSKIEQMLMREGVQVQEVSGRKKHLWSIYQKMEKNRLWIFQKFMICLPFE